MGRPVERYVRIWTRLSCVCGTMGGRLTEGDGVCLWLGSRFSFGVKGSTVGGKVFRWCMSASFVRCIFGTADRRLPWEVCDCLRQVLISCAT